MRSGIALNPQDGEATESVWASLARSHSIAVGSERLVSQVYKHPNLMHLPAVARCWPRLSRANRMDLHMDHPDEAGGILSHGAVLRPERPLIAPGNASAEWPFAEQYCRDLCLA